MKKILNKNPFWFLLLALVSTVLHNAFYAIFKFEEPVLFLLTFVFAGIFIINAIYIIIIFIKK